MPFSNRLNGSRTQVSRRLAKVHAEPLENRRLLSATVVAEAPDITGPAGKSVSFDVSQYLNDPTINTVVRFTTNTKDTAGAFEHFDISLFDTDKPISVANFLNYVRPGRYDGTLIHRATEPDTGLEVIQGGGYKPANPENRIPTDAPITNEAAVDPIKSNTAGTISMARTSDPNSATSEFFINTVDNSGALDANGSSAGYAVFGSISETDLAVAQKIQNLPTFDFSERIAGVLSELPVQNYTQSDYDSQKAVTTDNYVIITSAVTLPELTLSVSSSNPAIATPTIVGNKVNVLFGNTVGAADITVTATDAQGQSVSTTFSAQASPVVVLGQDGRKSVTFSDSDGTLSTISLKGAGIASIEFVAGNDVSVVDAKGKATVTGTNLSVKSIDIVGGNATTAITAAGKGGDNVFSVSSITADSALKSFSAKSINLTSAMTTGGSVSKLDLANPTNATITLGGSASDKPVAMTFNNVTGTNISSEAPVKSIAANSFNPASAGAERATIGAPAILSVTSKSVFEQNINVTGFLGKVNVGGDAFTSISADAISAMTVKGSVTNSSIFALRAYAAFEVPVGKITVGGALNNSVVRSNGNMGTLTFGSISSATIYAGIASSVNFVTLPDDSTDFNTQAIINTVTSKSTTSDFNLAGFQLFKANLGTLSTTNNGTAFGLASSRIGVVTATIGTSKLNLKKLDVPADVTAQSQGVAFGDFKIVLV